MTQLSARIPARFICAERGAASTVVVLCPQESIMVITGYSILASSSLPDPYNVYVLANDVVIGGMFQNTGFGNFLHDTNIAEWGIPVFPTETIRAAWEGGGDLIGHVTVWGYLMGLECENQFATP